MQPFLHPRRVLKTFIFANFAAALLLAISAHAQVSNFFTVAGYAGQGSADGAGNAARFSNPASVAVDASSNVYVADFNNNTIRKITPAGAVTTIAGYAGVSGNANGMGTNASFNGPRGIALDAAGNIYVADSGNNLIRKITSSGAVSTLAGSGLAGSANGLSTNASFNGPAALVTDGATNVYVADYGNHQIRVITPAGAVTTLAGSGAAGYADALGTNAFFNQPEGIAIDNTGTLYVADSGNNMIRKVASVGGAVSTFVGSTNFGSTNATGTSAQFYSPQGVAVDASLNVYVADYLNGTIREVSSAGAVTTPAGSPGNFGSANGTGANARFWGPQSVAVDTGGNVYVADSFNGTVRKVTSAGVVTTLAGSPSSGSANGAANNARFSLPISVALDTAGNQYVADSANDTIRKITPAGTVTTFAGLAGNFGSADGAGTNAQFLAPQGTAVDSAGNIYVADTGNHVIRKITSAGMVSTYAGFAGVTNNTDGTGTNAAFYFPQGITADASGNLFVTDTGNHTVRKIAAGGVVTTLAGFANHPGSADGNSTNAHFNNPTGVAVDTNGNVFVADTLNHTVRKITSAGVVTTIAGLAGVYGSSDGTNNSALFFEPEGIALDGLGNIFIADSGNNTIRELSPSGTNWIVTTVAGLAGASGSADGSSSNALFFQPAGMAFNSFLGSLFVADSGNNTIRSSVSTIPFYITNLTVSALPSGAIIDWNTTSNSTTRVAYGVTPAYGSLSSLDPSPTSSHAVLLTGLLPETLYYFEAVSTDGTNSVSATGSFFTDLSLILISAQAQYSGVWTIGSAAPDRYTNFYEFASTTNTSDTAQAVYRPNITVPGNYDVYIWYSEGSNRSTNVPATVSYNGGSVLVPVNESVPGGSWQLLAGGAPFLAGSNGFVRIGNGTGETGKVVIADAVRFTYSAGQDSRNNGIVPAWWANFYFGTNSVNGALDPDGDGYTTYQEYVLGTSPVDPGSSFSVTCQPAAGGGIQVVFSPFENGRNYQLATSSSLIGPVWSNLNLPVTQDTNGNGVITVTNTSAAGAYFRISAQMSQ
jgi:sugar lactone lactonase YvrE